MTTRQEYWDDVRNDAEDIVRDIRSGIEEESFERAWEITDFIFDRLDVEYIGDCEEVMSYTQNPDAIHEQGEGPHSDRWSEVCREYAVAAHREDLRDKVSELLPRDLDEFIAEVREEAGLDQEEEEDDEESVPPPPPTQAERDAEERKRQAKFFFGRRRKFMGLTSWGRK